MDVLSETEVDSIVEKSLLVKKYQVDMDRESAHEILQKEIEEKTKRDGKKRSWKWKEKDSTFDTMLESKFAKSLAKEIGNALMRWVLGALGLKVDWRRTFF